jgi:hypothetical protein
VSQIVVITLKGITKKGRAQELPDEMKKPAEAGFR